MNLPEVKIYAAAGLPVERHAALQALFDRQFAGSSFRWAAPQWHVLASIDGALAASARLFKRGIAVAGQSMHVGGVGGVMTLPEWRHRGLASLTLRRAAAFMRDELKVEFALLLCRDAVAPVYASWLAVRGWTNDLRPAQRAGHVSEANDGLDPWNSFVATRAN
jgi:GNAT superfamily N-acetyltransferase